MSIEPIRVILVDSEEVFREGMAKILKEQPHFEVIYQCSNGKEAMKKSTEITPDIVLMDCQISDTNALEVAREIRKSSPRVKVVMITRSGSETDPIKVLETGARGYLAKSISAGDLVKSLELISTGRIIISPLVAERFLGEIASRKTDNTPSNTDEESNLSPRQIEIAKLVAEGATNKEIAQRLFIAESTAKVHVKNTLSKLHLENRQQLAVYAVLQNWVTTKTTST